MVYVNYDKYNFCGYCKIKYNKSLIRCSCGRKLRTKRRRIIKDYLERRKQRDSLQM